MKYHAVCKDQGKVRLILEHNSWQGLLELLSDELVRTPDGLRTDAWNATVEFSGEAE